MSFASTPQFCGIANYIHIFQDIRFVFSLGRTAILVFMSVTFEILLGVGVALLFNRNFRGKVLLLSLCLIPMMISEIAAALSWGLIFDALHGPLNQILLNLHIISKRIEWLKYYPLRCIIIADIWQWSPFIMLVTLAGLQALPRAPYEAAMLDGASGWQQFRFITLPLLIPILGVGIILRVMDAIKMFGKIYVLTGGGPGTASENIAYYIYLQAFRFWDLPYASTLSFLLLGIVIVLTTIFFKIIRIEE